MRLIQVDLEKCDKDGICVEVCPTNILDLDPEQGPLVREGKAQFCIACGHCVAACPYGALNNTRSPLAQQTPLSRFPVLDPETAFSFLRSRRSIRTYKEAAIPRETMLQLLEIARYAPSGSNTQGISYLIIENRNKLRKISDIVVDWIRELIQKYPELPRRSRFEEIVGMHEAGQDIILRGAPQLIIATAAKELMSAQTTTCYTFEYVELYAPTLGLGTCWAGYVQSCAQQYPPLVEFLNIPEDKQVSGAIMVGYPKYVYHRLPDRDPLDVTWY